MPQTGSVLRPGPDAWWVWLWPCASAESARIAAAVELSVMALTWNSQGRQSTGAGRAVQNQFEPLAVRVVQAAYAVEFGWCELGVLHEPEKFIALIGADQGERASRIVQQVRRGALDIGQD